MSPEDLLAHADFVRSLARRLVLDDNRAADIVQDAWLAALEHPPERVRSMRSWFRKVVRNLAVSSHRRESRRARREGAAARPEGAPSAAEIGEREEARRRVVDAVLELEEPYGSAIVLRYYEDLTAREVADRLGLPLETVRTRLKRGLARLRARLDEDFGCRGKWCSALAPLAGLKTGTTAAALPGATAGKAALLPFPAGPSASAVAGSLLLGGGIVATKIKLGIAAVVILCMTAALWQVLPDRGGEDATVVRAQAASIGAEETGERIVAGSGKEDVERVSVAPRAPAGDPAAAPRSEDATVKGRVLSPEGRPVAGVAVAAKPGSPARAAASSAADGTFVCRCKTNQERELTRLNLHLSRQGFVAVSRPLNIAAGETVHVGDIVMVEGGIVSGFVVDENWLPCRSATVFCTASQLHDLDRETSRLLGPKGLERFAVVETSADGSFQLKGVPGGAQRVWARSEEHLFSWSEPLNVVAGEDLTGVGLILEPIPDERIISGVVLDPDGRPLPRASLHVTWSKGTYGKCLPFDADEKGEFTWIAEVDAPHSFKARDPDGRHGPVRVRSVLPGTRNHVLKLEPLREIRLLVRDEKGRKPKEYELDVSLPDEVVHDLILDRRVRSGNLESDGTLTIRVPFRRVKLSVLASGHERAEALSSDDVAAGELVTVTLKRGLCISGRVERGGEPVPGAEVSLLSEVTPGFIHKVNGFCSRLKPAATAVTTGRDGRFLLGPERIGGYNLRVEKKGCSPYLSGPYFFERGKEIGDVIVTLGEGGIIRGSVLPRDGESTAGLVVGASCGDGFPVYARSGETGEFVFEKLTPGRWQVEVLGNREKPGGYSYSSCRSSRPQVIPWVCEVAEGFTTHHDIDRSRIATFRLKGRFLMDGAAPSGWRSWVSPSGEREIVAGSRITVDGSFMITVRDRGTYDLTVSGLVDNSYSLDVKQTVELSEPESTWFLDIRSGRLEVFSSSGGKHEWEFLQSVWSKTKGLDISSVLALDEEGRAVLPAVPSGEGRIIGSSRQWSDRRVLAEFVVTAGEVTIVELR